MEKVLEVLKNKGITNEKLVCKICNGKNPQVSEDLIATSVLNTNTNLINDSVELTFVFIVCGDCGHVELYSAKHLGLV